MAELDLARQLVAYVDATTEPALRPDRSPDEQGVVVLKPTPQEDRRPRRRLLLIAAAVLALVAGLAIVTSGALDTDVPADDPEPTTPATLEPVPSTTAAAATAVTIDIIGGEVTKDLSGGMGWTFGDQPENAMSTPGPVIEVTLGDEVTVNFANRHGWSEAPDIQAVPQSFRIVPIGGSAGDVQWGADTGLVDPGDTASVTFVPDTAGEYQYLSTGFNSTGMFGRFVVIDDEG